MYETIRKRTKSLAAALTLVLLIFCCDIAYGEERTVIPLGKVVGIKLYSDGALVVNVTDAPAAGSDLRSGDVLLYAGSAKVSSAEQLQELLQENGGSELLLTYSRNGRQRQCTVIPQKGRDGAWRLGAWVRDSMAGIGTLTYYDPASGSYGALGHGITDIDTHALLTLSRGCITETSVKAVKRGSRGEPGELKGDFSRQRSIGTLTANTVGGVFGDTQDEGYFSGTPLQAAASSEVLPGKASILSTVNGSDTQSYDVEIVRLCRGNDQRDMLLRITDKRLLEATGGIVQGMSGSPILQNGKLVGAVTHVCVNDPTQGYGIFIDRMMAMAG